MSRLPSVSTFSYVERQPFFVRDYGLEGDDGEMHRTKGRAAREEEAIRMHNQALQAIEDAALARALELSKETALEEARRRYHQPDAHTSTHASSSHAVLKDRTNETISPASSIALGDADIVGRQSKSKSDHTSGAQLSRAPTAPNDEDSRKKFQTGVSGHTTDHSDQARRSVGSAASRDSDVHLAGPSSERRTDLIHDTQSNTAEKDNGYYQVDHLTQNRDGSGDGCNLSRTLLLNVKFFVPPRNCHKCGNLVERVQNMESVVGLHAVCKMCRDVYCRGCFSPKGCSRPCPGGANCSVENCCSGIRAIAAFDALCDFNGAFATALQQHHLVDSPHGCINTFMRGKDPCIRRFERCLISTLHKLPQLLRHLNAELYPSMASLVFASYLPQVIYGYLSHEDVGDWVLHSEAYLAILDALKEFPTCGLSPVSSEPLICHGKWLSTISPEKEVGDAPWFCLKDAIQHLSRHRKRLEDLSYRITFPATLTKVHNLSDGILQLLLQQIVN